MCGNVSLMKTAESTEPFHHIIDDLWQRVYLPAFEPIRAKAAQRHVLFWEEFLALMKDSAIRKFVTTDDDGSPIGLGLITNDLSAVSLIEPAFYEAKHPKLFAEGRIWYVVLVCAVPGHRDVYADLLTTMSALVDESKGIAEMDFCMYNMLYRNLHRAARTILSRHLGRDVEIGIRDTQSYVTFDLTGGAE
jgi:hypothetical protein